MGAEETPAEARDTAADLRDEAADERDVAARIRDEAAEDRDTDAKARDQASRENRRSAAVRIDHRGPRDERPEVDEDRRRAAEDRRAAHEFLARLREYQVGIVADRRAAADDRRAAAEDRRAAAHDRQLALWARQQAAVEAAEMSYEELAPAPVPSAPKRDVSQAAQAVELNQARRTGIEQQDAAVKSARQAAALAGEIAESEERVAATMRRLAAHGGPTATRRLDLAEQATDGMRAATERGDRLRELADRAGDDLVTTALRALLSHAFVSCTALAQTERSIAGAWESLAAHAGPDAAAAYRREARRANAAAVVSARRAQELRRSQLEAGSHSPSERVPLTRPDPDH